MVFTIFEIRAHKFFMKGIHGDRFNMKMLSYQYRKSHCGGKTILWSSYLHNGVSYASKMSSLYWTRALVVVENFISNSQHKDTGILN